MMIAVAVQPEEQQVNHSDSKYPPAPVARAHLRPRPIAAPEPAHLQAIHASRYGVILRGLRHETFWEW